LKERFEIQHPEIVDNDKEHPDKRKAKEHPKK